jgi:hypothetical protein
MDARELSDRVILEAMKVGHGTATFSVPGLGTLKIEKGRDERPFEFIQRVRREYGAWYAEQEYKANREARALQNSRREEDNGPGAFNETSPKVVQGVEASLESILQAKVNVLRERREGLVAVRSRANKEELIATFAINDIDRELAKALKFLQELQEVDTDQQAISQAMGGDIREEVGHGEPRSGGGVGAPGGPVVGGEEGQGGDTSNP